MENVTLPANLHYNTPNPDIPGLVDGRLQVVTTNTEWNGGIVGVNSFGFGGSNVHAVLKSNSNSQKTSSKNNTSKRLAVCTARTEEGVQKILHSLESHSDNVEFHALVNETFKSQSASHSYKGFSIINGSGTSQEIEVGK